MCYGDKIGPLLGKVGMQNLLQGDDELGSDIGSRFRNDRDETLHRARSTISSLEEEVRRNVLVVSVTELRRNDGFPSS